jgi:hypothetical protein
MSVLSSFFEYPSHLRFRDQEEGEQIEMFLRQHPITNVPWIVMALLLIFVFPGVFSYLLSQLGISTFSLPRELSITLWVIWLLLVSAYVIERFLHWYFNVYFITNRHLIDINFYSLLNSQTTEVEIRDVESTQVSVKGVIPPLFNYGNVIVQTAAESQQITFKKVPLPYKVADKISDLAGGIPHDANQP